MKRRKFIKKIGLTTVASFAAPYILKSGCLFAPTGNRIANHVVFCLFAGGVRSLEAAKHNEGQMGNLMPYILNGNIINNLAGIDYLFPASNGNLQSKGTLYKEFRIKQGPTGHYNGHATAMTGIYTDTNLNINTNPQYPTIFELYRKHNSPSMSALNAWWVSDSLGPYPALNYSSHPNYGPIYGANFIQPSNFFFNGLNSIHNPNAIEFSNTEKEKIELIRGFCDSNFNIQSDINAGIINTVTDQEHLKTFINHMFENVNYGLFNDPWNIGLDYNNDMLTIVAAEEVIKEFKPELMVVNMQAVDICHNDFTQYANNLKKCDYSVWHLWDTIQNTNGMKDDTILIIMPEHGRNENGNGIIDQYGRVALDHTGDNRSRETFCLILGPPGSVNTNQIISNDINGASIGENIDVTPTIAKILGFDNDMPNNLPGRFLNEAFI